MDLIGDPPRALYFAGMRGGRVGLAKRCIMRRLQCLACAGLLATAVLGCLRSAPEPANVPEAPAREVRRPNYPEAARPVADISWDTDRDRTFAEFLRAKSGGMLRKAAVGIDRKGQLQIELDRSVAPEDTLDLTKSVLAGARKDFPGQPITMRVFDPNGQPILTARYRSDQGVTYQLAHASNTSPEPARSQDRVSDSRSESGVTESDRKFAAWAEEHGRAYLRYVQADLERNGRLWFGVTREVRQADVPQLTKSLLEGAMKEFPRRTLTAIVFDPNGERIGKAMLDSRDRIRWEQ